MEAHPIWKDKTIMFGKPEWFKPKTFGWGLRPVTWQGWLYTLVWALVLTLPFVLFVMRAQWIEGGVWMVVALGVLIWDARAILKAMKADEQAKLFFIGEEDAEKHVETQNYDLHLRE